MTFDQDNWQEPTGEWLEKPAIEVQSGDYILDVVGRRLKVIASFAVNAASASTTTWSIYAYRPGEATRHLGFSTRGSVQVEAPEL